MRCVSARTSTRGGSDASAQNAARNERDPPAAACAVNRQETPAPAAFLGEKSASVPAHAQDVPGAVTPAPALLGRTLRALEAPLLLAVPAVMAAALLTNASSAAGFMLLVVALVIVLFFAGYESSRPALRQIMPTLVLAALAAAGRLLFGPIPDFKPVSAIAIIAGATLGPRNGFMVGALAAFTSNFFLGQGMWTPWQMYAWGVVGYLGGALAQAGVFTRRDGDVRFWALMACGLGSGLVYGAVINAYDIIGFVRPLTLPGALARLAAALPFDLTHALATCIFLAALYAPWVRRIERLVRKFNLRG